MRNTERLSWRSPFAILSLLLAVAIIVAMTGGAPAYAVPMHAITGVFMLALSVLMLRRSSSATTNSAA